MQANANKILIGGGTGFIGGALMQHLKKAGYQPIAITRATKHLTKNQCSWDTIKNQGLPSGCHAVVNLSGATIGNPWKRWTDAFKDQVWSSRIETTKLLSTVIRDADTNNRPKVFVASSAVGFYAPSKTEEYTEASPGGDDSSFFSKLCKNWERASELPENIDVRKVILRLGIVLGRPGGIIEQTIFPFKAGLGGPLGDGTQWFPWIHVDDVTGIILHCIQKDTVSGILNAVAPHPVTNAEFSRSYASACYRLALFPMPKVIVNTIFGEERGKLMLTGQKVIPKRTLQSRYVFKYPELPEALVECARLALTQEEIERDTSKLK